MKLIALAILASTLATGASALDIGGGVNISSWVIVETDLEVETSFAELVARADYKFDGGVNLFAEVTIPTNGGSNVSVGADYQFNNYLKAYASFDVGSEGQNTAFAVGLRIDLIK